MSAELALAATRPQPTTDAGPFKFLDFYLEQDAPTFAGRERDVREVVARICTNRAFVLYARSGLGKTSLLLAGVFPALRERKFLPVYIRMVSTPIADLCGSVSRELRAAPIDDLDGLTALLRAQSASTTIVLVFDQFEEFFIHLRNQPQLRREFVKAVSELSADPSLHLRVVFSLREDYLAELDEFRDDVEALFANDYRLKPLTAFGARQAIAQPLIHAGVHYDRRLLVRLVDLLADVGFDPLMLQILCTEVYRQASVRNARDTRLAEVDLEEVGGLEGVFKRYLDRVIAEIPKNTLLLSRKVLDAMITQEQTKRAVTFETLAHADFSAAPEEIKKVLGAFVAHRLVREEQRGHGVWYELAHERLIPAVLEWLELDEDFRNFRAARNLVANSCRGEFWRTNYETLLSQGALLQLIKPYEKRLRFTPLELEFLLWSAIHRRTPIEHWSESLGTAKSREIVTTFLRSTNEQARIGGAQAAMRLAEPGSDVADLCLATALRDENPAVRRAAGRALAAVGNSSHLEEIGRQLKSRRSRSRALDVVADLLEGGRSLDSFTILWRRWAKRIAEKRLRREHRETIRERGVTGALTGLIVAVLWAPTVGLALLAAIGWISGTFSRSELLIANAVGFTSAVVFACFFGWRIGRAAAIDAARHGEGRWFQTILGLRFLQYPVAAVSAVVMGLLWMEGNLALAEFGIGVLVAAAPTLMQAIVGAAAGLAKHCAWRTTPSKRAWVWSLVASAGLPLLVPGIVLTVLARGSTSRLDIENIITWIAAMMSLATAVAATTLARTAGAPPSSAVRDFFLLLWAGHEERRRVGYVVLTALAVLTVAWFGMMYGRDSVPALASRYRLDSGEPTTLGARLWRNVTDSAYFNVNVPSEQVEWQQANNPGGLRRISIDGQVLSVGNTLLRLPPGDHRFILVGPAASTGEGSLTLTTLAAGDSTQVSSESLSYAIAGFKRTSAKEWIALIAGTVDREVDANEVVYVYFPTPMYQEPRLANVTGGSKSNLAMASLSEFTSATTFNYYNPLTTTVSNGRWQILLRLTEQSRNQNPEDLADNELSMPVALKLARE